jgi:hypothetical protein
LTIVPELTVWLELAHQSFAKLRPHTYPYRPAIGPDSSILSDMIGSPSNPFMTDLAPDFTAVADGAPSFATPAQTARRAAAVGRPAGLGRTTVKGGTYVSIARRWY